MATLYRCLIALNGLSGPDFFQAEDSLIKPGYLVDTAGAGGASKVKICPTDGTPFGIAGCTTYHDLNTVWTIGHRLPVWMRGCGVDIMVLFDDGTNNKTLDKGYKLTSSQTDAGCAETWGYSDGDAKLGSFLAVIGVLQRRVVISGDTPTFVRVKMSV